MSVQAEYGPGSPVRTVRRRARRGGGRRTLVSRLFSPASAFLFAVPTIGYYTLATYANVIFSVDDSTGGVMIRALSVLILFVSYFRTQKGDRSLNAYLVPALFFLVLYSLRLFELMYLRGLVVQPGNRTIILIFFLSGIMPALMLAIASRGIRDDDLAAMLSLLAILFVIGLILNRQALQEVEDDRLALDRINAIALAHTAGSFLLYYVMAFGTSQRRKIEAILLVPVLLFVISFARSRGMLIATGAAIFFYVFALPGRRKVWALLALLAALAAGVYFSDLPILQNAIEAISRIGVDSDINTASRVDAVAEAWQTFLDNPWTGSEVNVPSLDLYPHNIYVESLMATGIFGGTLFLLHFLFALYAAFRLVRHSGSFAGTFISLIFVKEAVGAAASGSIWGAGGYWISSFLVISLWHGSRRPLRAGRGHRNHQAVLPQAVQK